MSGGRFVCRPAECRREGNLRRPFGAHGPQAQGGRGDLGGGRRRPRVHARRCAALRPLVQEAHVKALAIAFVAALGVAAAQAPTGGATNECRGIMACIRVPGPWVVVPPQRDGRVPAHVPRREKRRRRPRRPGDLARRASRLRRPPRSARRAGGDDDALRALPRCLDGGLVRRHSSRSSAACLRREGEDARLSRPGSPASLRPGPRSSFARASS